MIVTTTPSVEGRRIVAYLGIVGGEAILGANVFRDLFASIRDIVGGRSGAYERTLREAKDTAIQDMVDAAAARGADERARTLRPSDAAMPPSSRSNGVPCCTPLVR